MNPRAMRLCLEAWIAYDSALTLIAHRDGEVGWRGKVEPRLDRLYEIALTLTRATLGLHMGALGEGELSPSEVAELVAKARTA